MAVMKLLQEKLLKYFQAEKLILQKGVVVSGGVMGSVKLLFKCKQSSMPNISNQLGHFVSTNNEALTGVIAPDNSVDYSKGISITSGVYPDDNTHIETVRYGKGQDALSALTTPLVGGGYLPRQVYFFISLLKNPIKFFTTKLPLVGQNEQQYF